MPSTYGNASYRKKWDAFKVVDDLHISPLKEAIIAAQKIEDPNDRCHAWIAVCAYLFAKPRQLIDVSGTVTLEQVLAASNGNVEALPVHAE